MFLPSTSTLHHFHDYFVPIVLVLVHEQFSDDAGDDDRVVVDDDAKRIHPNHRHLSPNIQNDDKCTAKWQKIEKKRSAGFHSSSVRQLSCQIRRA